MRPAVAAATVASHAGFECDLAAHLAHGVVFATADFFLMARPVRRDAPQEALKNPWFTFASPDAWMVWLASGDLRAAMATLWPLYGDSKKWVAFQTDGPAKFIRTDLLLSIYGQRRKQPRGAQPAKAEHGTGARGQSAHGAHDAGKHPGAGGNGVAEV